ncbi:MULTISPECIES: hypothetical protein [Acidithiobacillus]|uniref:hypothetical protein n=1 Tax=Acidithiobacillus TaxID=119977 RepID=UPI0015934ABC|nr:MULTISPECIES: hypothetical protein [Acidithiobacillus]MDA8177572.1 hypothetical protein [Acidithiobacillus sp.]
MSYGEVEVSDELLCGAAFIEEEAPDLLIAAAWAINGYRFPVDHLQQAESEEDVDGID